MIWIYEFNNFFSICQVFDVISHQLQIGFSMPPFYICYQPDILSNNIYQLHFFGDVFWYIIHFYGDKYSIFDTFLEIKKTANTQINSFMYLRLSIKYQSFYIFRRYCPPTLNKESVICPMEQYLAASISTSNTFSLLAARSFNCWHQ